MTAPRPLLPPYPTGWYVISLSRDLAAGTVKPIRFMGQDVVLYRTQAGRSNVMGAYCPHLGAHLGYGGTVRGENIRCPFHSFEFDPAGACVSIPYDSRIPPKATAQVFPTQEKNGFVLAYYDSDGNPPTWDVPELDRRDWTDLIATHWIMRGHPQETTENSVDIGHFTETHGYNSVEQLKPLVTDGPYLTTQYAMRRPTLGRNIRSEFEIHVHGLGYSQVDVEVAEMGVKARLFVLATPVGDEQICLRLALSAYKKIDLKQIHPALSLLPRRPLITAIARATFAGFKHDVEQDIPIWTHKRYVQPPILAGGDGPVGRYRSWVKQFYTEFDQQRV